MSEFMKIQGYFNDNRTAMTKEEGRAASPARVFLLQSPLPSWQTAAQ
jgi:hypothetical protein